MLTFKLIKKSVYDIISLGLLARVMLFFKGILLAFFVGANYNMDTYLVAFSATLLLTQIIADGLTITMVPTLQEIDKRDGLKGRNDFTNNLVNSFILFSLILMLISFIIAPLIIKLMGPGFTGDELRETIYLYRLGLPIMTFHFLRAIGSGYLQSKHRFRAGAKSGVINPIVYILYLVTFGYRFGLDGLMITGIIAVMIQMVIMYQACVKQGYKYRFYIFLKERTMLRAFTFLLPIILGIGINEINAVVDNAFGSMLEQGTVSHLTYANDIVGLVLSIIVIALVTAIYPILAEKYNKEEMEDLDQSINYSFKLLTFVIVPIIIILVTLAEPIVRLFYERGEFGAVNTYITARVLIHYSLGILGMGFILLLIRIYYAIHDTYTPMVLGAIALGLNILFDAILSKLVGTMGIPIGTTISVLITALYGIIRLNNKLGFIELKTIGRRLSQLILSIFVMTSVIITLKAGFEQLLIHSFIGNLVYVTLVSLVGLAAFAFILNVFILRDKSFYF